jgi:hypothetical protein
MPDPDQTVSAVVRRARAQRRLRGATAGVGILGLAVGGLVAYYLPGPAHGSNGSSSASSTANSGSAAEHSAGSDDPGQHSSGSTGSGSASNSGSLGSSSAPAAGSGPAAATSGGS